MDLVTRYFLPIAKSFFVSLFHLAKPPFSARALSPAC